MGVARQPAADRDVDRDKTTSSANERAYLQTGGGVGLADFWRQWSAIE